MERDTDFNHNRIRAARQHALPIEIMDTLNLSHEVSRERLDYQVNHSVAWIRDDINPQDCVVPIGQSVREELMQITASVAANPLPTVLRHPDQFNIPKTRKVMEEVKRRLNSPPGVVVLESLPLDEITPDQATDLFWVIGKIVGRNVAQKWDGTMVYHVRDTGQQYGYGVRGSYTKVELQFHNDNAFGIALPDYVGLMCMQPSMEGGLSRFCSLYSVHNRLLEKYPQQLCRLYQPVFWDRQAEHADGEPTAAKAPVFRYENKRLFTRANPSLIVKGYEVAQVTMDCETHDAVAAMKEISEDESLWFELPLERGHIQYLNNIDIAHYRSEIVDHPESAKKRHLVRLWHRDSGQICYDG